MVTYQQARRLIERVAKQMRRLLRFGEFGDWLIHYEIEDSDHVGHSGGELLVGWNQTTPPYYQSDMEIAARHPVETLRRTVIHEHLHVVFADVRRAVTIMADGDTTTPAWRAYDDAEERAVTRLERAFEMLLQEQEGD